MSLCTAAADVGQDGILRPDGIRRVSSVIAFGDAKRDAVVERKRDAGVGDSSMP